MDKIYWLYLGILFFGGVAINNSPISPSNELKQIANNPDLSDPLGPDNTQRPRTVSLILAQTLDRLNGGNGLESTAQEKATLPLSSQAKTANLWCRQLGVQSLEKVFGEKKPQNKEQWNGAASDIQFAQDKCSRAANLFPSGGNIDFAAYLANEAQKARGMGFDPEIKGKQDPTNIQVPQKMY